jgi:hypothetical protein
MVDFFRDVSHGKLDLSGFQVFGWYELDQEKSDQVGIGKNQQGCADLIKWAREAAAAGGVDLRKFFSVVVSMIVPTDLFGGCNGAVADDGRRQINGMSSLSPSLLGHEMSHTYGLSNSRVLTFS